MIFKKYTLAAAVMAVMTGSAMAADVANGQITFHGMVNPNTCQVTMSGENVDQNGFDFDVTLDTVDVADVKGLTANNVSSVLEETPFYMDVKCEAPAAGTEAFVSGQFAAFGGATTDSSGILFPATNVAGAAQDVAYVVKNLDASGATTTQVKMGQVNDAKEKLDETGAARLAYNVAYVKTGENVTSGPVIAQAAYTISYE
ncbi:TPA: fimbrial protein [Salmonella enterica subsp. enterica serovar Enteritidis]|uniref:fimbrial protein n=1 Tax=Salmonella enterica TaxID=28901 RepID=UPI0002A6CF7D|nr:fimbrial protein [Salmonella enterica]ELO82208.1 major fimbrial protein StkA [Salmonella enterica subsp. enterica serovar Enteritidis str. SARB17]HAU6874231.1 fimbrial protein [Salmonella enterica subsp. enterica serovar Enteritidis]